MKFIKRVDWGDIVRFCITYIFPVIAVCATILPILLSLDVNQSNPLIDKATLKVYIWSTLIYQMFFLVILLASGWLVRTSAKREYEYRQIVDGYRYSDTVFRELADSRSRFDRDAFGAALEDAEILLARGPSGHPLHQMANKLDQVVYNHLELICNATARIIESRHRVPENSIAVHIKGLRVIDNEVYYEFITGSRAYSGERMEINRRKSITDLKFTSNACFDHLTRPFSERFFLNNDMEPFIKSKDRHTFSEPNVEALEFYSKIIVIPISNHIPFRRHKLIAGSDSQYDGDYSKNMKALLIADTKLDSKIFTFDSQFDLSIMREMAINAFSVLRMQELLETKKMDAS